MPSEHRKEELLLLLGNCVIAIALTKHAPSLKLAQDAAEQHIQELNRDYPGWKDELG